MIGIADVGIAVFRNAQMLQHQRKSPNLYIQQSQNTIAAC
jgi:hypothetical protein